MDFLYKPSYTMLKVLYQKAKEDLEQVLNKEFVVKGWIRETRCQSNLMFLKMYDGSHVTPLQLIFDEKTMELRKQIEPQAHVGACLEAKGVIVKSPAKGQLIEMVVQDCKIVGPVSEPETYLPGVKNLPITYPRSEQHLRPKFRVYGSIYRIRSCLLKTIHDYFQSRDFLYLDPNICTKNDCEGAGETFTITSLLKDDDVKKLPVKDKSSLVDFKQDFFNEQVYLTVSSQLQLEALCCGMGPVYTMNPSFRAEKSKTKRHLACFTHLEWEIPFIDLKQLMDFSEDLVTHCFTKVLKDCREDLEELNKFYAKGLISKLESFVKERFARITYDEAVDLIHKNEKHFREIFGEEVKELPKWGDDLGSCVEKYISQYIFKKPVFVHNYPRDLKSFYMKSVEPYDVELGNGTKETRNCVEGCDLLIPFMGELIGSSTRKSSYNELVQEMQRREMNLEPLRWYLDLRKNGGTYTGGAGLGVERLISICTSMDGNIRDTLPFPVSYEECYY